VGHRCDSQFFCYVGNAALPGGTSHINAALSWISPGRKVGIPEKCRGAIEKTNSFDPKLCRISAALRQGSNGDNDIVGFLVVRNEHHRRDASLFSIDVQFPKLLGDNGCPNRSLGRPELKSKVTSTGTRLFANLTANLNLSLVNRTVKTAPLREMLFTPNSALRCLLVLTLLICGEAMSAAAPVLIQSNAAGGAGVGSLSVGFPSNNSNGNLIIVFVRMSTTYESVAVSDTAGNNYAAAVSQAQNADGHQVFLFYAANINGGANSVTATFSSSNNHPWLSIYEYSGLSQINPLVQAVHAQGSDASPLAGFISTTDPSALAFVGSGFPATLFSMGTVTSGPGFTMLQQDTAQERGATEAEILPGPGQYQAGFTLSSATNWTAVAAVFQTAGATPSPPPPPPPPASLSGHYEYVFVAPSVYVYDIDHSFQLVQQFVLPTAAPIRGATVGVPTHTLYVSYGGDGDGNGNGSMVAYDLIAGNVLWNIQYPNGIDSMAITPDAKTIYMPSGELNIGSTWYVIDASNGNVTGMIQGGSGPHNTVMSLDGSNVYMLPRFSNFVAVASTATNTIIRTIGPVLDGVRPSTINGTQSLIFMTTTNFLGFQVGDINTGEVLYTVPIAGFSVPPGYQSGPYSHGISLSPNENELWVMDGVNSYIHVFDVTGLPAAAPKQIADLPLSRPVSGIVTPCNYDCRRDGWLHHSLDGRYVFVGDAGDVFDTTTRMAVVNLDPLYNTRVMLEIDWQNGVPVATTTRYGVGYVTQHGPPVPPPPVPPPPVPLPINLIQSASNAASGVSSISVSFPANNTAGNLIIVALRMSTVTQGISLQDTAGNSYATAVHQTQDADGSQIYLLFAKNIASGPNSITVTFTGTNNHPWISAYEYSGLNNANPVDHTAQAQGFSAVPSAGPAIVSTANELAFAELGLPATLFASGTVSPGTGDTLLLQNTGTSRAATEDAILASPGQFTGSFNLNSATNWSLAVAVFKQ
jgi:hypothetical protein